MDEQEQCGGTGWVNQTELGQCGAEAVQPRAISPSSNIKRRGRPRLGSRL